MPIVAHRTSKIHLPSISIEAINEKTDNSLDLTSRSADVSDLNLSPTKAQNSQGQRSSKRSKNIMSAHVSFRNDRDYTVVNEIEKGSYFGEISLLTNLSCTASIHTVSNSICGRMSKEALFNFFHVYNDSKKKMEEQMYKYKDVFFQSLTKIVKNVPFLKSLSHHSAKTLILNMRKRRVNCGQVIIKFREV